MEHELMGKLRARTAAVRFGNPARSLKLITVAGASGKTTTALLLHEILQEAGKSVLTLTNHGSWLNEVQVDGAYDTSAAALQQQLVFAKQKAVSFVIIEVSEALVASQVLPTLLLEMSIITGESMEAKSLLKQPVSYAVVPTSVEVGDLDIAPHQIISFGEDETAEARMTKTKLLRGGTELELVIDHQTKFEVATYLVGAANARNVAAAVAAAYVLAVDISTLDEGVARLERVVGNYEYIPSEDSYDIVVDRASSMDSLELVLSSAKQLKKRRLLAMFDGSASDVDYEDLRQYADRLVLVGDGEEQPGIDMATDVRQAIDLVRRGAKKDDLVLLMGEHVGIREADGTTRAHHLLGEKHE